MRSGTLITLDTLRRRNWRGLVLFAWLALAVVNLAGAFTAQAGTLPSDAEIRASICHAGAVADDAATPDAPSVRHCPLCLVMGSGGFAPPLGQAVLLRRPVETTAVALALADPTRPSQPVAGVFAPRAPPSVA
ncbi:hypothetical protein MTBLM5_10033 [Magnetospirillum sp. LM-5]|uniref:DUF2946 family protein n=1 Tax=Magnetospirillum sp. LM-5 TaxID=2681466 RepID=UPI001380A66E|nr:hypothetical protein [Magnetospirillum sp. LM-5]CAA7611389.1 hypothetical protein MTBLM5_10033 [Magnetospirillum sp. LM-5]